MFGIPWLVDEDNCSIIMLFTPFITFNKAFFQRKSKIRKENQNIIKEKLKKSRMKKILKEKIENELFHFIEKTCSAKKKQLIDFFLC